MKIDLTGKTALVCGSTGGIGKAIAHSFADCGASVILLARNEEKLKDTLGSLSKNTSGQSHTYLVANFNDTEKVARIVDQIVQKHTIDILVNNTGGPAAGKVSDANDMQFIEAFNSHLINNHNITMACLPGMKKKGCGRIVNIISTSVKQPLPNLGVSNTIRGAVANWSKTMATELAPYGITVNNLLPGATGTDRLSAIITNKADKTGKEITEIEKEMLAEIPAGRFADPKEPAWAVTFLVSDFAAYITGTNVVVDGGRTLCL